MLNVANDLSVLRTIEAELDMDDSIALSTIFPDMTDANISKMTTRGGRKSQRVKRGASADDSLDNVQCDSANDPPTDYISQSVDLLSDTVQRNSTIDSPTICNPDPKKKSKKVVKRRSARLKNATLDKIPQLILHSITQNLFIQRRNRNQVVPIPIPNPHQPITLSGVVRAWTGL